MNPSNNQGNNINNQWSEWSSASASSASKRDDEDDSQQRFHAQQGVNVAAMRNNHDIFPRFADHTYRDFSTWIKDGNKIEKHKKSDRNFPARLHAMLSDENFSHIISWMPHGRAWKVIDKELLVEEVIPKFFGQSKYASFTRQLSGWGFKRLHQTGPDFGCYYHECFLKGHPKLTALMRRVPPGQGKVTPNMHAEPDFYLMAERHPLEPSDDVPDRHIEKGLEASKISVSGRQKSGFPGDFEASGYARGDDLLFTRKTATPNMGSMSKQHQWDPFDTGVDSAHLQHHPEAPPESAMNQYAGNPANHLSTKRSSQPQPFASMDGTKKDESNAHEEMNFDPLPVSYQHPGARYRDRGYSDPFPEPNHFMAPHSGYSMHPAHRHQEFYGSNINQYAAAAGAGRAQSHQAAGYYYPPPHHPQSQQYGVHSYNNMSNHYWGNPYYNNHQSAQGLAHGQGYPQAHVFNDTARPQPHYPAQAEGDGNNHNSTGSLPSFSPMKCTKEDESKKSDSKPQN